MFFPNVYLKSPILAGLRIGVAFNSKKLKSFFVIKSSNGTICLLPAVSQAQTSVRFNSLTNQFGCILPICSVFPSYPIVNIINSKTGKPSYVTAPGTVAKFNVLPDNSGYKITLPSKRIMIVSADTLVQVGRNSNSFNRHIINGSAGVAQRRGIAQHVRQKAMNSTSKWTRSSKKVKLPWLT